MPPVDIVETADKDVVVKAELPDMKREDIKVTFENNVLTSKVSASSRRQDEGEKYHRVERGYGAFRRSFTLPATVDATRVEAELPGRCADGDAAASRGKPAASDSING